LADTVPEFRELEGKVDSLVRAFREMRETNESLKSELQAMRKRQTKDHMDPVKREIIRNKVQMMLNVLEDL